MARSWLQRLIERLQQGAPRPRPGPGGIAARCPHCTTVLRGTDRFCPQCGRAVSSAGLPTHRLEPAAWAQSQWQATGDYVVCLHTRVDRTIALSRRGAQSGRFVCVEVGYANETRQPLKYRPGQWVLYDTEGVPLCAPFGVVALRGAAGAAIA